MKLSHNEFSLIEKEEILEDDVNQLSTYKYIRYKKLLIINLFLLELKGLVSELKISIYKYNSEYYITYKDKINTHYHKFKDLDEFNNWISKKFNNRCKKCNEK